MLLEARSVTKRHSHLGPPVLSRASLAIARGELVCIVGASGSGKSTLLALLGGLDRPTTGDVLFEGVSLAAQSERWHARYRRERAAFVFQTHNLLPALTALENAALPLELGGVARRVAKERAAEALEAVGLAHRLEHTPSRLSGGECQRVAIARALAQRTDLILADEPTASLDRRAGEAVLDLLIGARTDARTVVIVTHDAAVAAAADRVFTVSDGLVRERPREPSGVVTRLEGRRCA
jgi:ABC-type lipoprotein export system ATPase subunit